MMSSHAFDHATPGTRGRLFLRERERERKRETEHRERKRERDTEKDNKTDVQKLVLLTCGYPSKSISAVDDCNTVWFLHDTAKLSSLVLLRLMPSLTLRKSTESGHWRLGNTTGSELGALNTLSCFCSSANRNHIS